MVREVRPDDLQHPLLRGGRQIARQHAHAVERPHRGGVLRDVVGERLGREHHLSPKPTVEQEHDLPGGVLFAGHGPIAARNGPKRASRAGGPRAEKERLGDERAGHDREVAGEMVAFEPPAPPAGARRTEHRDVVEVGVERVEARVHALQDALERHDVERLPIARGRGARAQEPQREASSYPSRRRRAEAHCAAPTPAPSSASACARHFRTRTTPGPVRSATATRGRHVPPPRPPRYPSPRLVPGALRPRGRRLPRQQAEGRPSV